MFTHQTLIFLLAINLTSTQYLFRSGKVSVREYNSDGRRLKRTHNLHNITNLDHHIFPKVIDIKVRAKINKLHRGAFKNMPLVKALRLSSCSISEIAPGAFLNLPNITKICLKDNHLETIEEGVFNHLTISELILQRNRISMIRSGAFDNLKNLVTIRLNSNRITNWDPNWFQNTPQLTELYFRKNHIIELPARAFKNLKSSHKINGEELVDTRIILTKNKIGFVHPEAFKDLDALYQIWLDRNRIVSFDKDTFSHMTQLEGAYFGRNKLSVLDKNMFKSLEEISFLEISSNQIECVPYEIASIVKMLLVKGKSFNCECIQNLRQSLEENGKNNQIKARDKCNYTQ